MDQTVPRNTDILKLVQLVDTKRKFDSFFVPIRKTIYSQ